MAADRMPFLSTFAGIKNDVWHKQASSAEPFGKALVLALDKHSSRHGIDKQLEMQDFISHIR